MMDTTIESRRPKWRRRALLCGLIAALSASTFYVVGESASFILAVTLFLICGYLLIDAMMGIRLRPPFDTSLRLSVQQIAETPLETAKFLALAALLGSLFAVAAFGIAYLMSQ